MRLAGLFNDGVTRLMQAAHDGVRVRFCTGEIAADRLIIPGDAVWISIRGGDADDQRRRFGCTATCGDEVAARMTVVAERAGISSDPASA